MKVICGFAVLVLAFSYCAEASVIGQPIRGQNAKETFLALTEACGGDCGLSGGGWQRAASAGSLYVECLILTADVTDTLQTAAPEKFTCTFNRP